MKSIENKSLNLSIKNLLFIEKVYYRKSSLKNKLLLTFVILNKKIKKKVLSKCRKEF